jgi:hypothetical protein
LIHRINQETTRKALILCRMIIEVTMKPLNPLDDLKRVSAAQRQTMTDAALALLNVVASDYHRGRHVVGRLLPKTGELRHWAHLPVDDVRDAISGACWFYHCHAPDAIRADVEEHGHFHLFIHRRHAARRGKLYAGPARLSKKPAQLSHYVALAMRQDGLPLRWFTVGQSVSGDYVYPAAAMQAAAHKFDFVARGPLAPTTKWLMAMTQLYQPTLARLLDARDKEMKKAKNNQEILSTAQVNLAEYLSHLDTILS